MSLNEAVYIYIFLFERKTNKIFQSIYTIVLFICFYRLTSRVFSNYHSVCPDISRDMQNIAPLLITTTDSLIDLQYTSMTIVRCGQPTPVVFEEGEKAGRGKIRIT